jgi:DNA end-binding protein Ku
MPRASWKGFLRLSLASCRSICRLRRPAPNRSGWHQVWVPSARQAEPSEARDEEEALPRAAGRSSRGGPDIAEDEWEQPAGPATRIALQPIARDTGKAVERDEVVKGYEFERGQFVTLTPAELKALDVESSKTIDLTTFVPRDEIDPLYYNAGYYIYPDGAIATEAYRVIDHLRIDVAGKRRPRPATPASVIAAGGGMALITLRSAEEVRPATD